MEAVAVGPPAPLSSVRRAQSSLLWALCRLVADAGAATPATHARRFKWCLQLLHLAALFERPQAIDFLLEAGANPERCVATAAGSAAQSARRALALTL